MSFIIGKDRLQIEFSTLEDGIAPNNPVRLLDVFVDKLELDKMGFENSVPKKEGRPPYDPIVFLKLYLYGYLNRIRSSRRLETECGRNLELRWLLKELTPNYHSIADFRQLHAKQLKFVFKIFTAFLKEQGLLGSKLVAIDGTKIRAQNSKKNNFNKKKIDRHLEYIEEKAAGYLKELDDCDANENHSPVVAIRKELVQAKIKGLEARKIKYEELQKEVKLSDDGQVSATDADSRALSMHHNIVEISYNAQTAVDDKHCLIAEFDVINKNDINALYNVASETKSTLEVSELTVLADKGYHNGSELQKCEESGISTVVAYREIDNGKFIYDKDSDSYTCPQNETLKTTGTWHEKKKGSRIVRVKLYRTPACKSCPLKSTCTAREEGREIERSQYQDTVDRNNKRVDENQPLYKRRQAIVEHPFGTIKRAWGYTYTLLKGLEKVKGEIALIFLSYNIRRSMSILGVEELIRRLKDWKGYFSPLYTA
jgi:transposase